MKKVLPKHLTDVEAIELIWGPPEVIRSEDDLRDYQVWMADKACGQDGVFLAAEMGLGKAQPFSAQVQTPIGPRPIGALTVGDPIFGADGKVHQVVGVFPQGEMDTYRVTFRDGVSVECNQEHLWAVRSASARDKTWRTLTLKQMIRQGISRQTPAGNTYNRWEIPITQPLQYAAKDVPIDPYVLGVVLGDGCVRGGCVLALNGEDAHIESRVRRAEECSSYTKAGGVRHVSILGIRDRLRSLSLYGRYSAEKFVPEIYMHGSEQQRRDLLAGLLDTDGSCNTRGSVSFSSMSPRLAQAVQGLVQSLGGVAVVRGYDRTSTGKGVEWRVSVRMNENPFTLPRKAERWVAPKGQCRVQRRITAVTRVRREPHVCIATSAPDQLYLTDHHVVTHNTAACLLAISRMLEAGTIKQVLIVAPLRVAEETWPEEIAKWAFARHLKYRVVTGTEAERLAALEYGPCQITIVNRENLHWLYDQFGARRWPYHLCVYDEASRLSSGRKKTKPVKRKDGTKGTPRTSELGILSQVRHKMRVIELSGTPAPKGLINLWGPIYLIDKGYRLGRNKTDYERRWFSTSRWEYEPTPHPHSEAEIMDAIKDVFFALKEEDYLSLPPLVVQDHRVVLPPAAMAQYRKLERESAIWVKDGERDPEVIKAVNEGVLTGKLLQFANGSLYREDGSDVKIHDRKLDVLASIIEEAAGRPILCAYSFKFDMAAIKKRFPWVRIFGETPNDKRDWDAGRIRMLLTHPASAGHGLNFQHSSNIAVWYGLTWSAELYLQFIKRLHRSGQKEDRVFLHRILARNTVDESVVQVLRGRQITQDRITSAVRVRLSSALSGLPEPEMVETLI